MNDTYALSGKIVSGAGQAAFFTQLDWVQQQCAEKLGFKPFPGTLNLEISEEHAVLIESLGGWSCLALIPPDLNFCSAQILPVNIEGIRGAIVIPAGDVQIHAKSILEVIAPVSLKESLGIDDGDIVRITIMNHSKDDKTVHP